MILKQKELVSALGDVFSKQSLIWLHKNEDTLVQKFHKKYPRARNGFHAQLLDNKGSRRTLVLRKDGTIATDMKNSYHNILPWAQVKKMGAPAN